MTKKNFVGRNGLTFSTESLRTILETRSVCVSVFGAPAPKFDSHESMQNWAEKQIAVCHGYIENLDFLREVALDCIHKKYFGHPCPECDALIEGDPSEGA